MRNLLPLLLVMGLLSCDGLAPQHRELPYLGRHQIGPDDTVYHQIPPFRFMDQDSNWVTHETLAGKVYVADFFFVDCPTICPKMKTQMLRIYEAFEQDDRLVLLSHSINPNDSVPKLHAFAHDRLGVDSRKWHFVTGDFLKIQELAQQSYMVTAMATPDQPETGGYIHDGRFLLVDGNRHIRGTYDGTDPVQVTALMSDIKTLLRSEESAK